MRTVSHREMRNQSGDLLRRVAAGETVAVTNHGQIAALMVPPGMDTLSELIARGQVRVARGPLSDLESIKRSTGTTSSGAILADSRSRW